MSIKRVEIPPKLIPVFEPDRGAVRYRGAFGGRGSSKSYSFAMMAALWGMAEPLRILATREFQASIKESFHAELRRVIQSEPWIEAAYDVGTNYIKGYNGTEFIFRGLRHSMNSIKSTAGVDLCIVEEAEDVPEMSWEQLVPTIRSPKSEIWAIWNPLRRGSPVDDRFRVHVPDNGVFVEMNHTDNPWFPEVLEQERLRDQKRLDPSTYAHIWEGAYLENSNAQVLHGKVRVSEFEPGADWDGPYFGLDYGFAADPSAAVKSWVHADSLYVEAETGGVGVEIDDTSRLVLEAMPEAKRHTIRADNARPESTSYLKRNGLPLVESVTKWPGSIADGIAHLRSYREIIVHPRCHETIKETRLYAYKTDRLTGDILPVAIDANNHYIDALRYSLAPLIRNKGYSLKNV